MCVAAPVVILLHVLLFVLERRLVLGKVTVVSHAGFPLVAAEFYLFFFKSQKPQRDVLEKVMRVHG